MGATIKSGRLSRTEREYIDANMSSMSDVEIADKLGRSIEAVAKRRAAIPQINENKELESFIHELHEKHFWPAVKSGLLDEEVVGFDNMWAALSAQFVSQGVTASDEIQMKDLIIEDIMLHRALTNRKNIIKEIRDYERYIAEEGKKPRLEQNTDEKTRKYAMIVQLRGSEHDYTKEITELKKTKDSKFKDLKATRQERLKTIEESGKNVFAMITILDERNKRETEGCMAAMVAKAAENKRGEFEQLYQYSDGEVDRPFTTPESEVRYAQEEYRTSQEAGDEASGRTPGDSGEDTRREETRAKEQPG